MSTDSFVFKWILQAEELFKKGSLEKADNIFAKVLKRDEKCVAALNGRGRISEALGFNDRATEFFQKANEQEVSNYCLEAEKASEEASYQDAIECYKNALNIIDDNLDAIWGLAECYASIEETKTAARWYQRYLDLEPEEPEAMHMLSAMGALQTPDRASEGYIKILFDRFAPDFDELLQDDLDYRVPTLIYNTIEHYLNSQKANLEILDLGCGTGLCGEAVKQFSSRIDGVDLSVQMLKKAKQKLVYNNLINSDVLSYLKSANRTYDIVLAADVFVYFGALEALFSSLNKVVKPRGLILFSLEIQRSSGFSLMSSGRYSHSRPYVRKAADQVGFTEILVKSETLRLEYGEPVWGDIWLYQK